MKKDVINSVYSCFDQTGKLTNQTVFSSKVSGLISSNKFNSTFDVIINTKSSSEILQFLDGIIVMGLGSESPEVLYILNKLLQAQDPWLRNVAPLIKFELDHK